MSSGRHALRLVDRHGGVVTTLRKRLARVQAYPDPNGDPARPGMRRERTLRVPAGEHGLPRVGEGQEQAIPERLDHDPVPFGDRSSDQGVVLRDQGAKALTEVLVELGRRLDVSEAERDESRGQRGHAASPRCCLAAFGKRMLPSDLPWKRASRAARGTTQA
jgi:hypothetical protein